jgi:hypothetical protein
MIGAPGDVDRPIGRVRDGRLVDDAVVPHESVDHVVAVQAEILRVLPREESGVRRRREGRDGLVILQGAEVGGRNAGRDGGVRERDATRLPSAAQAPGHVASARILVGDSGLDGGVGGEVGIGEGIVQLTHAVARGGFLRRS